MTQIKFKESDDLETVTDLLKGTIERTRASQMHFAQNRARIKKGDESSVLSARWEDFKEWEEELQETIEELELIRDEMLKSVMPRSRKLARNFEDLEERMGR